MLERLIMLVVILTTMPVAAGEILTEGTTVPLNEIGVVLGIDAAEVNG